MPSPGPAVKEERNSLLRVSFGAREAKLAVIDSASRRHRKMGDFGEERVRPLTLCPNSDAAMTVVFAPDAWSSERETVREALNAVPGLKRSMMSGAQSAP